MRPIWYFVGILLSAIGLIVVIAGLLNLAAPPPANPHLPNGHPALAYLHVDLWWGGIIFITGLIFLLANRHGIATPAQENAAAQTRDPLAAPVASDPDTER